MPAASTRARPGTGRRYVPCGSALQLVGVCRDDRLAVGGQVAGNGFQQLSVRAAGAEDELIGRCSIERQRDGVSVLVCDVAVADDVVEQVYARAENHLWLGRVLEVAVQR